MELVEGIHIAQLDHPTMRTDSGDGRCQCQAARAIIHAIHLHCMKHARTYNMPYDTQLTENNTVQPPRYHASPPSTPASAPIDPYLT